MRDSHSFGPGTRFVTSHRKLGSGRGENSRRGIICYFSCYFFPDSRLIGGGPDNYVSGNHVYGDLGPRL